MINYDYLKKKHATFLLDFINYKKHFRRDLFLKTRQKLENSRKCKIKLEKSIKTQQKEMHHERNLAYRSRTTF